VYTFLYLRFLMYFFSIYIFIIQENEKQQRELAFFYIVSEPILMDPYGCHALGLTPLSGREGVVKVPYGGGAMRKNGA